mmetsp:Transcript_15874/g.19999  ORF Transcript_15874/g.19999 Transcript_15874/m.19999 type:complete len:157 (-) Transcript_15874:1317-1787(-)
MYISFLFGCAKLLDLYTRKNPTINTYPRKEAFSNDERFNSKDEDFMMAFALEDFFTSESLSDPRYVKWFAHYSIIVGGEWRSRELPIYPCKEEDYEKFYPIDERSASRLSRFKSEPDQQLQCIDWDNSDIDLYGVESTGNVGVVDVIALPCNVKLT